MLSGIRDILVISTPSDTPRFHDLLSDGSQWGVNLSYAAQPNPGGLAEAFIIGRDFVRGHPSALVLGDNIFYGHDLPAMMRNAAARTRGATVFAYQVQDPHRYGVIELGEDGRAVSLEEKPAHPKSRYAVTGLYFYDEQVVDIAGKLKPSARGELEITDVNSAYMVQGELHAEIMGRGIAWLDTGTHDSLVEAATFIQTIEKRQGLKVSCPEEIAYRCEFISADDLERRASAMQNERYRDYLFQVLADTHPEPAFAASAK
jgi:glucose-1-phosphate thymidylyltransferase